MTESNVKHPVWQRIVRGVIIAAMLLATVVNVIVFAVAGLPQLKSFILENRMTRYVLAHHDEMTEYALRLHDEEKANTVVDYQGWKACWYPVDGSDAYVVQFICRSWGIAPSTGYEGVYYSSDGASYDLSQTALTLDHDESEFIGFGWYWYRMIT